MPGEWASTYAIVPFCLRHLPKSIPSFAMLINLAMFTRKIPQTEKQDTVLQVTLNFFPSPTLFPNSLPQALLLFSIFLAHSLIWPSPSPFLSLSYVCVCGVNSRISSSFMLSYHLLFTILHWISDLL